MPYKNAEIHTLMSSSVNNQELNLAKKVHRFVHRSADDTEAWMMPTGYEYGKIKKACTEVVKACPICETRGRPKDRNKISTTHVNDAIGEEICAYLIYIHIRGKRHEVLKILNLGTKYGARILTKSRTVEQMME